MFCKLNRKSVEKTRLERVLAGDAAAGGWGGGPGYTKFAVSGGCDG